MIGASGMGIYLTFQHYKDDGYVNIREGRVHWENVRVPVYNWGGWYDYYVMGDTTDPKAPGNEWRVNHVGRK